VLLPAWAAHLCPTSERYFRGSAKPPENRPWNAGANFGHLFSIQEEIWNDDHLQFRVSALGQVASGSIDVAEDHVRLEVLLPWLLAKLAESLQPLIRREGTLLLEKK
jgi:hypothetical protein